MIQGKDDAIVASYPTQSKGTHGGNASGSVNSVVNGPFQLSNLMNIDINNFITTGVAVLGATLGRDGCDLKAACLAGTLIPSLHGKEMIML